MEGTNKKSTPSSWPAHYVTITELKERWLKEKERQQKEEEEEERLQKEKEQQQEELRQQKLREERAKQPKPNAVVRKPETDSRPRNRRNQRLFRPAKRNVSEPAGAAELEGKKSEKPEEEKTGRRKNWEKKKNVSAEKEVTAKEGTVDAPQASSVKGSDQAARNEERKGPEIEIRAKSKNVAPVVPKFRNLSVNGENERGGDRLRRPGRVDHLGSGGGGEIRVHRRVGRLDEQRPRGFGRVWVKKGEVADGNGGGVQSLECKNGVSGQTGTSLNVSSLKLAGQVSKKMPYRRSERNANCRSERNAN